MSDSRFPSVCCRRGLAALVIAAGALGACSSISGPSVSGTYSLARINGQALPAVADAFNTVDGDRYEIHALNATILFGPLGRYVQRGESRRVINGVPGDSILPGLIRGQYFRRDSTTIVVRFTHIIQGFRDELVYDVLDDGRLLVGMQDFKIYEWIRD